MFNSCVLSNKTPRIDLRFDVKEDITQETFKTMINQTLRFPDVINCHKTSSNPLPYHLSVTFCIQLHKRIYMVQSENYSNYSQTSEW